MVRSLNVTDVTIALLLAGFILVAIHKYMY